MSHVPGALGWADAPAIDQRKRLAEIHDKLKQCITDTKPNLIIAFLDDHFENHFRQLMPTLGVPIADSHIGPAKYMMKALKFDTQHPIPSNVTIAKLLHEKLIHGGFEAARMGEIEYGNNLMMPLKFIRPEFDIEVVPIYINVFSPPLMPYWRAYDLGLKVREIVDSLSDAYRVHFLATGGLSHWPPVWTEGAPEQDTFLQRMKVYQTIGKEALNTDPTLYSDFAQYEIDMMSKMEWPIGHRHPLVNEEWDREMLHHFEIGDIDYMRALTFDEVETRGGHGGHEALNWVALMGAMKGTRPDYVAYESVPEWITGMSYLTYPGQH
ncbi:extradiol dioxygenase [Martelella alba]|nr:extradiol dioxygenase [Martelella alba]